MPRITAVCFDMGDTITDLGEGRGDYERRQLLRASRVYELLAERRLALSEREAFSAALANAIETHYQAALAEQKGLLVHQAMAAFFAEQELPFDDALLQACADAYYMAGPGSAPLRAGAVETLAALRERGLALGVISNTIQPGRFMEATLKRSGLFDFFAVRCYSSEVGVAKPHPGIFRAALDGLHVAPEAAVHVGDRLGADVFGAQGVGMRAVLIEVAGRPPEYADGIQPDATIAELPDLIPVIDAWL